MRANLMTVDDVLAASMVAYPFTKPMCCVVTDGGGALILTSADRAATSRPSRSTMLGSGEAERRR